MATLTTVLMWTGIALGGLIALVILAFVVFYVWTMFTGGFSPKGVELDVSWPPLLALDQTFTLGITIRNLLDTERFVHSIDLDRSLLKGFVVKQLEPKFHNNSTGLGTTAYHFESLRIPPRGHTYIALSCHTVVAGDYTGTVYAYVDYKNSKSVDKSVRLVIR